MLERGIIAHALEEWDAEARSLARCRGQDTMRSAGAHAVSESLEALADGYDKGAGDGRTVDPFSIQVLGLEAAMV